MRIRAAQILGVALGVTLCGQVLLCPYTKVEESFTIQAVHDILTYGVTRDVIPMYDHITFSGAVPRSFLGPLLLAGAAAPFVWVAQQLGASSAQIQTLVRLILAVGAWISLWFFARCLFPRSSLHRAAMYAVTLSPFHLPFWASRTTPNGVAFPLVTASLGAVIHARSGRWLGLATLACVTMVLRLELLGMTIPCFLWTWLYQRQSFQRLFVLGFVSCGAAIGASIVIDSYFWQTSWLWPELHAILFNVVEGKSAEWGTSPWHAYVTRELPRLLAFSLPLVLVGNFTPSTLRGPVYALALPPITLLSLLPHKEWRFILYTVPLWNALGAVGMLRLGRSWWGKLLCLALLLGNVCWTGLGTWMSMGNYPGGVALAALHAHKGDQAVHVHIDTLAAMTGVSLFQSTHVARPRSSLVPHLPPPWVYNKTEAYDGPWCAFTHRVSEYPCNATETRTLVPPIQALTGRQVVRPAVYAGRLYAMLRGTQPRSLRAFLPIEVHQQPALWVCETLAPC
ncbi:alpha-mannosyltransferase subunit [Malassezia pachydermatis]|uniref:Mannosyltransferase n=1 Tax=Malassezia pachydermatis TaxID=77020 RepID=A0A0M8MYV0_9BASI|nr:alpha-mannosyltransferase subunit [Malassezia pachydermatis]KOS16301.1 alpha-mannosyltransferase subunit [Malassezia pachydermatis]